ncbi:PilZ domain-containing protein [Rhizobium sp. RU20A]|uniref:PilZ domain-containing protein n=1 Tax=Rhizobium sp. RU20A TaxID=1907412 RepID=UPI000954607F|nr:PilZ domain-containing protein [Rhizobium sp. RU20A]SIQ12608.1 PilZ domain-containing protein [Rhizobium sp. RU20A]
MYQFQQSSSAQTKQYAEGSFQRVGVKLQGRLMLSNREEFDCLVDEMSPGDAVVQCDVAPRNGERIIAYLDHVGRIEGTVARITEGSFVLQLTAPERKREKLAAQLTWIANKHELGLPEDRRHDRLQPRRTRTTLALEDGSIQPCRLLDLSLSGAAVDVESRPPLGTAILLGSIRGRVVRHFQEGVAIEFNRIQTRESLAEFL